MFYHVKELQFNARVSRPDPAFARLLLEQFGGANGELAAAMHTPIVFQMSTWNDLFVIETA